MAPYSPHQVRYEDEEADDGVARTTDWSNNTDLRVDSSSSLHPPTTTGVTFASMANVSLEDLGELNSIDDDDDEVDQKFGQSQRTKQCKLLLYAILLLCALFTSVWTWFWVRRGERQTLEHNFDRYATAIVDGANANVGTLAGQLETLSTSITSRHEFQLEQQQHKEYNNNESSIPPPSWQSVPHWDTRTSELQALARSELVLWAPLVPTSQIVAWEKYTQRQRDTIARDSFSSTPVSSLAEQPPSPVVFAVPPSKQQQQQHNDDGTDNRTTAAGTTDTSSATTIVVPILQYGPLRHRNHALVNLDLYSHAGLRRVIDTVVQTRQGVLIDLDDDDVSFLLPSGIANLALEQPQMNNNGATNQSSNRSSGPTSVLVQPVVDRLAKDPRQEEVVGVVVALKPWSAYLETSSNLLLQEQDEFVVRFRSTCGKQEDNNDDDGRGVFGRTFRIRHANDDDDKTQVQSVVVVDAQQQVSFDSSLSLVAPFAAAQTSAHEQQRRDLEVDGSASSTISSETDDEIPMDGDDQEAAATAQDQVLSSCKYTMVVYPSLSFEDRYYTAQPYWYAVFLLAIFLATAVVFVVYDSHVQRKERRLRSQARDSAHLVQTLFPKEVGQRVMNITEKRRLERELERIEAERLEAAEAAYRPGGFLHGDHLVASEMANAIATPIAFLQQQTAAPVDTATTTGTHNASKHSDKAPTEAKQQQQQQPEGRNNKKKKDEEAAAKEEGALVFHHIVSGNFPLSLVADSIAQAPHRKGSKKNSSKKEKIKAQQKSPKVVVVKETIASNAVPVNGLTAEKESKEKDEVATSSKSGTAKRPKDLSSAPALSKGQTSNTGTDDAKKVPDPIADYYPESTIMFADIVGFASWSAVCEPKTIFLLLETLYSEFDAKAKQRRVYKIETVSDCYVAVAGVPEPHPQHFMAMARFAMDCLLSFSVVLQQLEPVLGPETRELALRAGLHSGPVAGGILRNDRARFQLFGDTMNTASRMESNGCANRIHISQETADLLRSAGKGHWLRPRKEMINVKGKGRLQTYWIVASFATRGRERDSTTSSFSSSSHHEQTSLLNQQDEEMLERSNRNPEDHLPEQALDKAAPAASTRKSSKSFSRRRNQDEHLASWTVDILGGLLQQVVAGRQQAKIVPDSEEQLQAMEDELLHQSSIPFEELDDTVTFPPIYAAEQSNNEDNKLDETLLEEDRQLNATVAEQLEEYIHAILAMHHPENEFHNFEHASHMTMCLMRLFSRMVPPKDLSMPDHTLGLGRHVYAQFCMGLAAIIHDADHAGLSNAQLCRAETVASVRYGFQSVAEQHAVDVAWRLLLRPEFTALRRAIYTNAAEFRFVRQTVVHAVLATDLGDPLLMAERTAQWSEAFGPFAPPDQTLAIHNFKRTMVMGTVMQAASIFHALQHWQIYVKWNRRLFREHHTASSQPKPSTRNDGDNDPAAVWSERERDFFEMCVVPLATRLQESGVLGEVAGREFLHHAGRNQVEWRQHGRRLVQDWKHQLPSLSSP